MLLNLVLIWNPVYF